MPCACAAKDSGGFHQRLRHGFVPAGGGGLVSGGGVVLGGVVVVPVPPPVGEGGVGDVFEGVVLDGGGLLVFWFWSRSRQPVKPNASVSAAAARRSWGRDVFMFFFVE